MLKFYYVGEENVIGMSVLVLRGNGLKIKLGLVFKIDPPLDYLEMTKGSLIQKRSMIPTQISSQNLIKTIVL